MKKITAFHPALLALVPAALLVLASGCSTSSNPKNDVTTAAVFQPGVPGGTLVESYKITATVTGVDAATRQVSLAAVDGSRRTVQAGPEFTGFDQLKPGDKVRVSVTKALVVSLGPNADCTGEAPGMMAETVLITAKVTAIDLAGHRATLQFPDGSRGTYPVRPDVDLTQRQAGETVNLRATQVVKLLAETP